MNPRIAISIVIGGILFGLGTFIAVRPLFGLPPVTRQPLFDLAFAALFLLRGSLNIRSGIRLLRASKEPPSAAG